MNARWYAHHFDDAAFLFLNRVGLQQTALPGQQRVHCVTAQTTTRFQNELLAGDCFAIFGSVARIGTKSTTFSYQMMSTSGERCFAICESVEVFVDAGTHTSVPIPDAIRAKLEVSRHEPRPDLPR
jgi:acyl-CoA thioester hydrolase